MLFTYLYRVLDPIYWNELRAGIRSLGHHTEEATMTIAEMFREQGREQGRQEGCIATLRRLLVLKFQALDTASEARLQTAPPEAIDHYLERLLTANSLAAVFED